MRSVLAVIEECDVDSALDALCQNQFDVTQIASIGGFLREGNATLLVGVDERWVEEAIGLLRVHCHRRKWFRPVLAPAGPGYTAPAGWCEMEVGSGMIVVMNVEHFGQL
jgi:uncharacterized protein YaaQ